MRLIEEIKQIDGGRFVGIIDAIDVKEICGNCYYFNKSVDRGSAYKCRVLGSCPAATLSYELQSYIATKLGWKIEEQLKTMGLK